MEDVSTKNTDNFKINDLGKSLLVVNPVAQSGKCRIKGQIAFGILKRKYKQDVDLFFTEHVGHAKDVALEAAKYDTIIAIGGDGVVHEIALGLMEIDVANRPALAVIPVGSGNDYARSLGISFNVKTAVDQLMRSNKTAVDVGKCNDQYYVETLSFGLDAGIAIDTMEARKKHREKGFKLYFKCGVNRIKNHFDFYNFKMVLDDNKTIEGNSLMMAIQIGKTYGGGFKITPKAKMDDGYFDICYSKGKMGRAKGLYLFARAAKGLHINSNNIEFARAKKIHLEIDEIIPCQLDGEKYENTVFDIEIIPLALNVYKFKQL